MENYSPENRIGNFVDHGDGTVTDTRTGLMWMRCALGQTWDGETCVGEAQRHTLDEALVLRHDFAGHNDWRLPDIDELKSIVDRTRVSPAIDVMAFPNTGESVFWSASANARHSASTKFVRFSNGSEGYCFKTNGLQVRLVRAGLDLGTILSTVAHGSPSKVVPMVIQGVRAAINLIRQRPELFAAEIAELRGFLGEAGTTHVSASAVTNSSVPAEPETLEQVVAWLVTQQTVALSDLRIRLLPLDLFPGAVIDDLNDRALDLTGDPALEECGDSIIVTREVLERVISAW